MRISVLLFVFSAFAIASVSFAAESKLPAAQKKGGPATLEAIDKRASAVHNNFPASPVDDAALSTILWAASGLNRDGMLWTVPMALGKPPYCKIYVSNEKGVFLYKWRSHSLEQVSKTNANHELFMQAAFKNVPAALYIVADGEELAKMNNTMSEEFSLVLAGAMSQNIYLAAQSVNVGTRVVYSIKREDAKKFLNLGNKDKALFGMPMGKY